MIDTLRESNCFILVQLRKTTKSVLHVKTFLGGVFKSHNPPSKYKVKFLQNNLTTNFSDLKIHN